MSRYPAKFFLTILFFFAVACCSSIKICPARSVQPFNQEAHTFQAKQIPNAELERVHPPTVPAGQTALQKNLVLPGLLPLASFYQQRIAAESSFIKASSLLVKDYLFFIYPYHNFW